MTIVATVAAAAGIVDREQATPRCGAKNEFSADCSLGLVDISRITGRAVKISSIGSIRAAIAEGVPRAATQIKVAADRGGGAIDQQGVVARAGGQIAHHITTTEGEGIGSAATGVGAD